MRFSSKLEIPQNSGSANHSNPYEGFQNYHCKVNSVDDQTISGQVEASETLFIRPRKTPDGLQLKSIEDAAEVMSVRVTHHSEHGVQARTQKLQCVPVPSFAEIIVMNSIKPVGGKDRRCLAASTLNVLAVRGLRRSVTPSGVMTDSTGSVG
jgi:hypothetical protein